METYLEGALVHLTNTFQNAAGTAVDPATVTLRVQDPAGTVSVYTYSADITRDATGQYSKDISASQAGVWQYRWEGTGTVAVDEESFRVRPRRVPVS